MALDVLVMPIWKFKAGDYSSRIDRFAREMALELKTVRVDGTIAASPRPSLMTRWRARRETRRLRRQIAAELGRRIDWNDEGPVVHSEQGHNLGALQAYARWLDVRDLAPTFEDPPGGDFSKHPAWNAAPDRPVAYPQVYGHSLHSGYFLPTEFDRIVEVEPYTIYNHWHFTRSAGSAPRLFDELTRLGALLEVDEQWDWKGDGKGLHWPKGAWVQLMKAARLSREHNLPIIFCG